MICSVCHKEYSSPSLGGPGICPSCDVGKATEDESYKKFQEVNKLLDEAPVPTEGRTGYMTLQAYIGALFTYSTPQEATKLFLDLIGEERRYAKIEVVEQLLAVALDPENIRPNWVAKITLEKLLNALKGED